ncbi:SURF1 family protein [Methylocystis parvus]|uniref:SURF1-like protein n=1 Tax=Methylocystis parvus TaxID=134 RepID=A0A6B8LY61_9HYPH|nr:SURF1 family protein [Methylocystis parvus]QGM96384.1 SURF1 family protein [Methylocystis parvus]WBJ99773.1 SURF1 family protein [Methylocystis parvus OBBP]
MRSGARALLWPAVATALAFALLVSLGAWQVRRLGEKEALIARVEARARAPAQPLPERSQWAATPSADYEFTHVQARGRYLQGRDALIFMKAPEGFGLEPGYMVATPFALSSGGALLVERGFVPASRVEDAAGRAPPSGEVEISGLLRAPQARNMFTPADAPERRIWYTRDPAAVAATLGLAEAAPFALTLEGPSSAGTNGFPRLVATAPEFPNNHLSYAFTWFSLAAALLVIFALFARGRLGRDA